MSEMVKNANYNLDSIVLSINVMFEKTPKYSIYYHVWYQKDKAFFLIK